MGRAAILGENQPLPQKLMMSITDTDLKDLKAACERLLAYAKEEHGVLIPSPVALAELRRILEKETAEFVSSWCEGLEPSDALVISLAKNSDPSPVAEPWEVAA